MRTHPDESTVVARVEKMLAAAEHAGLDLHGLEMQRRRLARDIAEYDALLGEFGNSPRTRRLERAIELGVDLLASAFVYLRHQSMGGALAPLALRVALRYRRDVGVSFVSTMMRRAMRPTRKGTKQAVP